MSDGRTCARWRIELERYAIGPTLGLLPMVTTWLLDPARSVNAVGEVGDT
jgi:hypothetical protein